MPAAGPTDPFAQALSASPALFPHAIDPRSGAVTLVHLREAELEAASFLDDRLLGPGMMHRTVGWAQLAAAAGTLPEHLGFLFHIGHVGSTLVARLLGAHPDVLALREPQVLRTLAQAAIAPEVTGWSAQELEERTSVILRLLSRRFRPAQMPIVKTTSYVSELAGHFMSRVSMPRALFLTVSPVNFLATILGAENSPAEARMLAPSRLARLAKRTRMRWRLEGLSPGEVVAMGWASEMTALARAAEMAAERVLWMDFDRFLAEPQPHLARAFAHFGITAAPAAVEAILAGPDMQRYSKAPEHPYDAGLRAEVLREAHRIAGEEIMRGQRWLDAAAQETPTIAAALAAAH